MTLDTSKFTIHVCSDGKTAITQSTPPPTEDEVVTPTDDDATTEVKEPEIEGDVRTKGIKRPSAERIDAEEDWVDSFGNPTDRPSIPKRYLAQGKTAATSVPSKGLAVPVASSCKPRSKSPSPQQAQAYTLWHEQKQPLDEMCALLRTRENPLKRITVM